MPDLFTHVLTAYIFATVLSWRYDWISPPFVTVAMAGAMTPDLNRFKLLIPAELIESTLGIPFDWGAFHTLGGATLVIAIGSLITPPRYRRMVTAMLVLGALSHLSLDLLLIKPSGHSYAVLWPLTQYHPPTPNLFLSSDRWPALVTGVLATGVWIVDRRHSASAPGDRTRERPLGLEE